jgi:hypothetical protein
MEAARGRQAGSQPPQPGKEDAAAAAAEQGAGDYLGVSMGGTSRAPFRAPTGTEQGDKIPLGSFLTAEAAARAYDRWAGATPGRALNFYASYKGSSACASRQRAALTTRLGARVHGLPQQRDDDDDDEAEQLTDSDWSDGDEDDGDETTSVERAARDSAQRKAPAAGTARASKADCAQYVGVYFEERKKAAPFYARICFKSKVHRICSCPTAEAAARAYDAVACMIPGRKLNFRTMSPAAASNSPQREGACAVPLSAESDILAAITAVRQAKPQLPPTGAFKFFGVCINKTRTRNPYQASIWIAGKKKRLGCHPTLEAAARAYDAVARTIHGHKLNFPTGGSGAGAAAEGLGTGARSLPAHAAGHPSQPPRVAHDDDGSPATGASACTRKRKEQSSSSLCRAGSSPQRPVRQQHLRQKTHASAAQMHHPLRQPSQQLPDWAAHVDPARRTILELFLAGIDEDGVPLNGPSQVGLPDLTVAELQAMARRQ